jgi:peptide/nickel transport system substrate-binding protein
MSARRCSRGALAALLATGAVLAAGAGDALAQSGTLRTRLNSDIRSTDPGTNRDENTDMVVQHMVEGLVAFRENTAVGPLLAERWDVSPDGRTYRFTLREGVRFHNGVTLTPDDVVWTWKRYMDPATRWRCLTELDGSGPTKLLGVEASDARTVSFTLERPWALLLAMMARPDCGGTAIYHRDSVAADGKWRHPIGTGPFRFGEWRVGQHVELVRFDGYVGRNEPRDGFTGGKKAEVEKVRFLVIPDASAAKAALLGGSLDATTVSSTDFSDLKGRSDVALSSVPSAAISAILLQTRDPVMKDVRIRRALALSLDSAEIVAVASQGTASANNSPIPVGSSFYGAAQRKGFQRDVAAARKLLAEAGYTGQPIKMLANKRYEYMFSQAVVAQAMAQEAGIRIELEVLDWATQLDRYSKGDYQSMSFAYSARLDPSLSFEVFTGPKATQPRKVWDDPEAQALLQRSMRLLDPAERQPLFDELQARLIADVPLIALYNPVEITATRRAVVGFQGWPAAMQRYWGVAIR